MTDELADFYVHSITVETFTGTDGYGREKFSAPVTVPAWVEHARKLVRSSAGEQVVSETTVYCAPTWGDTLKPGSRVTFRGAVSTVITVGVNDSGPLGLPDHCVAALT